MKYDRELDKSLDSTLFLPMTEHAREHMSQFVSVPISPT